MCALYRLIVYKALASRHDVRAALATTRTVPTVAPPDRRVAVPCRKPPTLIDTESPGFTALVGSSGASGSVVPVLVTLTARDPDHTTIRCAGPLAGAEEP
jgi:hypothetical protein